MIYIPSFIKIGFKFHVGEGHTERKEITEAYFRKAGTKIEVDF
jgi:hypothetical protein